MELTQDEVLKILDLIEKSNFDYMQLQVCELKLTVSKGNYVPPGDAWYDQAPAVAKPRAEAKKTKPKEQIPAPKPKQAAKINAGGVEIKAPMVGTFYAAPEPGAKPFVELGA